MSLSRAFSQTNPGVGIHSTALTNQFQGGGDKKAGFPYQVGRIQWTEIALKTCDPTSSQVCCNLVLWNTTKLPIANISRPIGSNLRPNPYWKIFGAGNG
jgi:hypothetical protein